MKEKSFGPITTKLAGVIKLNKDIDYKKEFENMVFEKYSIKKSIIPIKKSQT